MIFVAGCNCMRKMVTFILLSLLVLFGCSSEGNTKDGDATINVADLTDAEESLIEIMNSQSFAYDVEINNKDVKEIQATVDYYENGEFVKSILNFSTEVDSEDPIRTVFMRQNANEDHEQWTSAVIKENGHASAYTDPIEEKLEEMELSAWDGLNSPTPLFIGEKKVVAHIIQTNKDGISSLNNIETEADLKATLDYEQVYIMSVELK